MVLRILRFVGKNVFGSGEGIGINTVGERIRVLAADIGNVSGEFAHEKFSAAFDAFRRVGGFEIAVGVEHVGDFDGGALVVDIHEIRQPDDFFVGIEQGRGGQEYHTHVLGIFSDLHQEEGRLFTFLIVIG